MTGRILVPVAPSPTLRETLAYAVELLEPGETIHLVRTVSGFHVDEATIATERRVLERAVDRIAAIDPEVVVSDTLLGVDRYLAGPAEHVELIQQYAAEHGIDELVLDPNYALDATAPTLQSLDSMLANTPFEITHAPVAGSSWRPTSGELIRGGLIGLLAFGFYVALGGAGSAFTLWSGVVTGGIAAIFLRNVAFETTPQLEPVVRTVARGVVFVPYLLWEITKANVIFAYVVLHPSLPIDPRLDRVDAAVSSGLSVTAFANSITLTPGTLTVDADGHHLLVHSLNASAQDDLFEGVHEGAVRYLFYGREGMELPSPKARDDAEPLVGPATSPERGDGDE